MTRSVTRGRVEGGGCQRGEDKGGDGLGEGKHLKTALGQKATLMVAASNNSSNLTVAVAVRRKK
jgi:hypothetical protein